MKNSMMKITQMEGEKISFGLIPISNECIYLEARFSLDHKVLTVMTKTPMTDLKMLPKLDSNGNPKRSAVNKEGACYERVEINSFYSFIVTDRSDIETLVNLLDSTVQAKDLEKYFAVEETPQEKGIILDKNGK